MLVEQMDHVAAGDLIQIERAERWQHMVAQQALVGTPAAFVGLHMRQVGVGHELGKGRHRLQRRFLLERIFPHCQLRELFLGQLAGIRELEVLGAGELLLDDLAAQVAVAQVIGLFARGEDFQ